MNWRNPRVWIATLAAAGVVSMAVADLRRSAPGPVAAVHARVEALDGGQSCRKCHGGLLSNMTSSCLSCHAMVATQLDDGDGVHGRLGKERASQCALCHSEHHGADFALVNSISFAQAGLGDAQTFDHARIGYDMRGRHLEAECSACHLFADADVLRAGQHRYLGLTQKCTSCHFDAHAGRMQVDCTACHGQDDFGELQAAGHDAHLPLVGGHAGVGCTACHAEGTAHALAAVGERRAPAGRTCRDCHASPHQAGFVTGAAPLASAAAAPPAMPAATTPRAEPPTSADACAACHRTEQATFAEANAHLDPAQHAHTGFALEAPHDLATCAQCHQGRPGDRTFAARHPGRSSSDCAACHEDPHGGQFAASPQTAGACIACHAATGFAPTTFDLARHDETELPLVGAHRKTACADCHLQTSTVGPRVFRGTTTQCDGCHADAHDAFFAAALAHPTPTAHGACAHCHVPTAFADVPSARFDHGVWTGFALGGSHAEAGCDSCHRPRPAADAHGRRFGKVADSFPPADGCQRCHLDPHDGRFDAATLAAETTSGRGCARCHDDVSFRALPHGFDHGAWTGFALDGSHARADCSGCHPPLAAPEANRRSFAHARGRACAACHADPHAGQFTRDGGVDCARCHRPTHFKSVAFNHNLDARFTLGDAHADVKCSACHKPERIGEVVVARYRPLPRTCVECHGAQEETLRRRKRRGS